MPEQRSEFKQREPHPDMFHEPDVDGVCLVDDRELLKSWFIPANERLDVMSYTIEWGVAANPKEIINQINEMVGQYESLAPEETKKIDKRHRDYFPQLGKDEAQRVVEKQQNAKYDGEKRISEFKRSYPSYDKPLDIDQIITWIKEGTSFFRFYTSIGTISWNVEKPSMSINIDRSLPTKPLTKLIESTSSAEITEEIISAFVVAVVDQVDQYKFSR